jgi:HEAT repeat protein
MDLKKIRETLKSDRMSDIVGALNILRDSGDLGDLQEIMPLTKNEKVQVRTAASAAVCAIIREKLVSRFNDLQPDLRAKLGTLLSTLNPAIVQEISQDIYSSDATRRVRAVQTLGLLKRNPQIRALCAKLVTDRDEKIRATAVNLLGKMVGSNDQEIILALLSDKDKRVRANTVEALESLNNKRMVPILQRFRKDPNNRIRGNVLKALYAIDAIDIQPDLLAMISSGDEFMQASALWVISRTGIQSTILEDAAGHCLLSENEMVLNNATNALNSMATPRSKGYLTYLGKLREQPQIST